MRMNNKNRIVFVYSIAKKYSLSFISCELMLFIVYFLEFLPDLVLASFIDQVVYYQNMDNLFWYVFLFIVLIIGYCIAEIVYDNIWVKLLNRFVYEINDKAFLGVLNSRASYLANIDIAYFNEIINNDTVVMLHFIQRNIFHPINAVLAITIVFIFMLQINVYLAIWIVFTAIARFIITGILSKKVQSISEKQRDFKTLQMSQMIEMLTGFWKITCFSIQKWAKRRFIKQEANRIRLQVELDKIMFVSNQGSETILFLFNLVFYIASGIYAHSTMLTIGGFLAIIALSSRMQQYSEWIITNIKEWKQRVVYIDRVKKIIDGDALEEDSKILHNSQNQILQGKIEFKSVNFGYNQAIILDNISLIINPGDKIGIVGPSGVGKSTFSELLLSFYNPDNGEILLDDQKIETYSKDFLRQNMSVIMQDIEVFPMTVLQNLTLSNPTVSFDKVKKICEEFNILEMIESLPNGFETVIDQNTNNLSGGQKQRIMIVRALLKDVNIYLFDELTSALDVETEKIVMNYISNLSNKTVIVISHRYSTIKHLDLVYVLKKGKIDSFGKPEFLQKESQTFRDMFFNELN